MGTDEKISREWPRFTWNADILRTLEEKGLKRTQTKIMTKERKERENLSPIHQQEVADK